MASLLSLFKQASYVLGDQYKFTLKPPVTVFTAITGKDGKAGGIGFERTQDFRLKAKAGGHPRHLEVASPPPL